MRTHGHREGSITHYVLPGGKERRDSGGRGVGERYHGEKCQI